MAINHGTIQNIYLTKGNVDKELSVSFTNYDATPSELGDILDAMGTINYKIQNNNIVLTFTPLSEAAAATLVSSKKLTFGVVRHFGGKRDHDYRPGHHAALEPHLPSSACYHSSNQRYIDMGASSNNRIKKKKMLYKILRGNAYGTWLYQFYKQNYDPEHNINNFVFWPNTAQLDVHQGLWYDPRDSKYYESSDGTNRIRVPKLTIPNWWKGQANKITKEELTSGQIIRSYQPLKNSVCRLKGLTDGNDLVAHEKTPSYSELRRAQEFFVGLILWDFNGAGNSGPIKFKMAAPNATTKVAPIIVPAY